jgi:UDP-GlcNAc:undecaprenyl-phosphate GlcNAc-1-phosphate transferase
MHPSLEYLLVGVIAAAGSYVLTPLARRLAVLWGAIARPRDRDVHAVAIPRMGGAAIFAGFALALFVAARLPTLHESFHSGPELAWVLFAGLLICVLGVLDDRFELDSLTKLAGQVLAAAIMVTRGGVQLANIPVPGYGTFLPGADLAIPVTIGLTVLTINAVNFIDGLDGLLAGVTVIGATAFFLYAYHLGLSGRAEIFAAPTLLSALLAGACLGFLPHNFSPARVFMGDSGSMLVGLMLSAAVTTATTSADPQTFAGAAGSIPLALPLLIPVAILIIPLIDLVLAVIRRVRRGQSPFAPDKRHLHHRLLEMGHSHRRAVLFLYLWSALLAYGGVGFAIVTRPWMLAIILAICVLFAALISFLPPRRRGPRTPDSPAQGMVSSSAQL